MQYVVIKQDCCLSVCLSVLPSVSEQEQLCAPQLLIFIIRPTLQMVQSVAVQGVLYFQTVTWFHTTRANAVLIRSL